MTTALVPTFNLVEVETPQSKEKLGAEAQRLTSQLLEVEARKREAHNKIRAMETELQTEHSDLYSKLHILENNILLLEAELNEEPAFEEIDDEDEDRIDALEETELNDFDFEPVAKRLYARIAKYCHPDKTSDPELNAIFIAAAKAMCERDWETIITLAELVNEVAKHGSSLRAKLLGKITGLRAKLIAALQELNALLDSEDYKIAEAYHSNAKARSMVSAKYRDGLSRSLQERMEYFNTLTYQKMFGKKPGEGSVESRFGVTVDDEWVEPPAKKEPTDKKPAWWEAIFGG